MTILEQIHKLIDEDRLRECFTLMRSKGVKGVEFQRLQKEFIAGKRASDIDFADRIKVFADVWFEDGTTNESTEVKSCPSFNQLYHLNFTHQTQYFTETVKNCKPILNFVLRESDSFLLDWLVRKIVFHYEKEVGHLADEVSHIEVAQGNLHYVLEQIGKTVGVPYKPAQTAKELESFRKALARKFGNRLESGGMFYVLKNAHDFIHSHDFVELYEILTHIYNENDYLDNKCVFLFVEHNLAPYNLPCLLSSAEVKVDVVIEKDDEANAPFFIDLDIIQPMTNDCLTKWAKQIGKFKEFKDCIEDILSTCDNGLPAKVIPHVAEMIGIDNFETILHQKGWY